MKLSCVDTGWCDLSGTYSTVKGTPYSSASGVCDARANAVAYSVQVQPPKYPRKRAPTHTVRGAQSLWVCPASCVPRRSSVTYGYCTPDVASYAARRAQHALRELLERHTTRHGS